MSETPTISLTGIHLYPVKGAAGLSLQRCTLDSFGIVHDRRWMVVDSDGVFLSQRSLPRMALLSSRIEDGTLILDAPGMPSLRLSIEREDDEEIDVRIWRDRVRARVVKPDAEEWMSDFLTCPARLVHMEPDEWRGTDPKYAEGFRVSFVDGSRPDEPVPTQPGGRGRRTLWGRRVAQDSNRPGGNGGSEALRPVHSDNGGSERGSGGP